MSPLKPPGQEQTNWSHETPILQVPPFKQGFGSHVLAVNQNSLSDYRVTLSVAAQVVAFLYRYNANNSNCCHKPTALSMSLKVSRIIEVNRSQLFP